MHPLVGSFFELIDLTNDVKAQEEDAMFPLVKMLLKYFGKRPPQLTGFMFLF